VKTVNDAIIDENFQPRKSIDQMTSSTTSNPQANPQANTEAQNNSIVAESDDQPITDRDLLVRPAKAFAIVQISAWSK
jgi:hypothetical protein